jgi:hypothetical protein
LADRGALLLAKRPEFAENSANVMAVTLVWHRAGAV